MRRLVRYMILAGRLTTELDRLELPSMARPVPTVLCCPGDWRESPLIACCQLGPAEQLTRWGHHSSGPLTAVRSLASQTEFLTSWINAAMLLMNQSFLLCPLAVDVVMVHMSGAAHLAGGGGGPDHTT